jgi:hypothetical protein
MLLLHRGAIDMPHTASNLATANSHPGRGVLAGEVHIGTGKDLRPHPRPEVTRSAGITPVWRD